jgi:hypothetical protein
MFMAVPLAHAEVREAQPAVFTIESSVTSTAAPTAAYAALTRKVSQWWDPEHTWSGSARNLSIDARAGGCFCEKFGQGGSVQHARVIWAEPGKTLRLEGAFGPLQDMAVNGVLTFKLVPAGTGTKLTMTYRVAGAFTMDAAKLAPLVDQVLTLQLKRLGAFADTGKTPAK